MRVKPCCCILELESIKLGTMNVEKNNTSFLFWNCNRQAAADLFGWLFERSSLSGKRKPDIIVLVEAPYIEELRSVAPEFGYTFAYDVEKNILNIKRDLLK